MTASPALSPLAVSFDELLIENAVLRRECDDRGALVRSLLRAAISDRVALRDAEARIAALRARVADQQALISQLLIEEAPC